MRASPQLHICRLDFRIARVRLPCCEEERSYGLVRRFSIAIHDLERTPRALEDAHFAVPAVGI